MNHISIRNALVEILDEMELTRKPKVSIILPGTAFSQKELPLIIIETPTLEDYGLWDNQYVREVYSVTIHFIDAFKNSPDGQQKALDYLYWLRNRALMHLNKNKNIRLPHLHIHNSFLSYNLGNEIEELEGANLVKISVDVQIPVIVEKETTWDFSDGYGYGYGIDQTLDYNNLISGDI